jgi:hypothetical protein
VASACRLDALPALQSFVAWLDSMLSGLQNSSLNPSVCYPVVMSADCSFLFVMQGNRDGHYDDRLAERWQNIVVESPGGEFSSHYAVIDA